jgi:hypothetical protein
VIDVGVPTIAPAPFNGLVMLTIGTVTLATTAFEVPVNPAESSARAVRLTFPATVGVHWILCGADTALPINAAPARKSTRLIVVPAAGVAVALTVTFEPKPKEVPLVGLASITVGPKPVTLTIATGEGAVLLLLAPEIEVSVTVAEMEYVPVAVGNQSIE